MTIHNVFYQVLLDTKLISLFTQVHMARYINTQLQYSINTHHIMYASDYNWLLDKANAITFSESLSTYSKVLKQTGISYKLCMGKPVYMYLST